MSKRVGFISLGCAKNLVNTEQMMYLLSQKGYEITGETHDVDVVVINTCSFIESARTEAIDTILEIAEQKAKGAVGKIVVAGCLPQRYKDEILVQLPEIDTVLGTGSFDDIVEVIEEGQGEEGQGDGSTVPFSEKKGTVEPSPCPSPCPSFFKPIDAPVSETGRIITTSPLWAYIKIAEGCDNRCAYCCIPDIRGPFRSRRLENIVNEAQELVNRGTKELILVAQDVTRYGFDLYGKHALPELLRELGRIENLVWIRLMYLYPDAINDELIDEIVNNDKIVRYLDIPIQHISDKILRNMNRRGTGSDIKRLFKKLRAKIPGLVLRTSVIAGLPGEGEEEFEELFNFLREAKIERAGVFTYSPEEGTPAALMPRPDKKTAKKRARAIEKLQSQIMEEFEKSRNAATGTATGMTKDGKRGTVDASLARQWNQSPCPTFIEGRSYAEAPEIDGVIL